MLDDIRNLIGDIASGKTKDATIQLSQQEASLLRAKLDDSDSENQVLRQENAELKLRLSEFDKNTEKVESKQLPDEQVKILKFLSNSSKSIPEPKVLEASGLSLPDFQFHIGELLKDKFVSHGVHRGSNRVVKIGQARRSRSSSYSGPVYGIYQKGRQYTHNL